MNLISLNKSNRVIGLLPTVIITELLLAKADCVKNKNKKIILINLLFIYLKLVKQHFQMEREQY